MKGVLSICVAISLGCSWCGVAGATTVRTVVLSGDFPAGTPKVLPGGAAAVGINDLGLVNFVTQEDDPSDPFFGLRRLWTEDEPGEPRLMVSAGDTPFPESGSEIDSIFLNSPAPTNEAGQTLIFPARLTGPGVDDSNNVSVWIEQAGSLQLVARTGDQVPGFADDVVFAPFFLAAHEFNEAGQVLLSGPIAGPDVDATNDQTVWLGDSSTLRLIAREGDQAPGMPAGVSLFSVSPPIHDGDFKGEVLNDTGQSVLDVELAEDGVNSDLTAIYVEHAGSFRLVAKDGDAAPGLREGVVFQSVFSLGIDAAGQTAFVGTLEGQGFDVTNHAGIWKETGDVASLVARQGIPAPGTDPGVTFQGIGSSFGPGGDVVIKASLTGPGVESLNRLGIWTDAGGTLELVARSGDQAPGFPDGVPFQGFSIGRVNEAGQFLIQATVGDDPFLPGVSGIWATDRNGDLQLIVAAGDVLEVAPGEFRTVASASAGIGSPDAETRTMSFFNARGEVLFGADFTDGTHGIFVSDRVAVPEPASAVLLALGGLVLLAAIRFSSLTGPK